MLFPCQPNKGQFWKLHTNRPIPVAMRPKTYVCDRSIPRIAGSNPTKDMEISLLCLLCFVQVVVSATGCSLVQRSPTGVCVCARVCVRVCVSVSV
jgi:hypothetical protein